ncbi:MAG: carboxylating nicotinate-nucleotide diphosphorylase [Candidatus Anstonellaceae archaeon]
MQNSAMDGFENFRKKPSLREACRLALLALSQDAKRDITSRCIPKGLKCKGRIIAKSDFVLCGVVEAGAIFSKMEIKVRWHLKEGQEVRAGQAVCSLEGNARKILACERTALNYLCSLSGIATLCRKACQKYGKLRIAATRKTLPLLSHSQKRAVEAGGCLTHRLSLSDGYLLKDNHIAAIMAEKKVDSAQAIKIALERLPKSAFVEVEVSGIKEAISAAECKADALLVDNASVLQFRKIAVQARKVNPKIIIEASGGITLKNAGKYLEAGADFASTSQITMKAPPADMSLELDAGYRAQ